MWEPTRISWFVAIAGPSCNGDLDVAMVQERPEFLLGCSTSIHGVSCRLCRSENIAKGRQLTCMCSSCRMDYPSMTGLLPPKFLHEFGKTDLEILVFYVICLILTITGIVFFAHSKSMLITYLTTQAGKVSIWLIFLPLVLYALAKFQASFRSRGGSELLFVGIQAMLISYVGLRYSAHRTYSHTLVKDQKVSSGG